MNTQDAPSGTVDIEICLTVRVDNGHVVEVEDIDYATGATRTALLSMMNADLGFRRYLDKEALRQIERGEAVGRDAEVERAISRAREEETNV